MQSVPQIAIALIALIHGYIFVFEAFLWERRGPKVFTNFPLDLFAKTKALAFNQGIYNMFLASGLIWSLCIDDAMWAQRIAVFFLSCVALAGIAGAATASRSILWVQTVPALMTLGLVLFL